MAEKRSYWITRYALTSGIFEVQGSRKELDDSTVYICHGVHGFDKLGVEAFPTLEEAREDQRKRAAKAIASAEKKIAKLKELL